MRLYTSKYLNTSWHNLTSSATVFDAYSFKFLRQIRVVIGVLICFKYFFIKNKQIFTTFTIKLLATIYVYPIGISICHNLTGRKKLSYADLITI